MKEPSSPPARDPIRPVPDLPLEPSLESTVVESYRRLADVLQVVLSEQSLDALFDRIADTLGELVAYDDLHIHEADEDARTLKVVFVRGEWATEMLTETMIDYGEGITGWAAEHRRPVLANQAHLDPRARFAASVPIQPQALVVVPLIARDRVKGVLKVYRVGGLAAFSEDEFQLLARFGDAAALALDNAQIRAALELQAQTDPLTGLLNHRAFHELLRNELVGAPTVHRTVAVVMVDLDDFKRVNDVYGHDAGDGVLAKVAHVLLATVRSGDAVCRIGGEEFAMILPGADLDAASRLADRLAGRLRETELEPAGHMSASVGVAVGPDHAANPRELAACAEAAMMTAKARGKNRVVVFGDGPAERPRVIERRGEVQSLGVSRLLASITELEDALAAEGRERLDERELELLRGIAEQARLVADALEAKGE